MNNLRVAWLVPVAWFYWQPMLSEFSKKFPQTKVFTALFPGYSKGYEDSLNLQTIGKFQVLKDKKKLSKPQYGSGYTALSPKVILPLLKYQPDLVFTSSFGLWTLLALLFKPLGRWKVIIAYEGSAPGVDFRNSPLRLGIRKLMVLIADGYITNSKAGKAYLIDFLKAEPQKVFAHPYEVPSEISLLADIESKPNKIDDIALIKPVFLFVGRIMARKGVNLLLEACVHLKQQKTKNYTLLVVGDGQQRQELETFCQDHQLQNCVKWIGKVDYQEVSSYFQAADVFVLPTIEDTWGVVTLEVMLFGKAVLCSAGAGSSELVIKGENGYVFQPHQSIQLAQLMQKFIDEPNLAVTMGAKSRQMIAAYSPKKAAEFLATTIKSI